LLNSSRQPAGSSDTTDQYQYQWARSSDTTGHQAAQIPLDNSSQLRYWWTTAGSSDTARQQQAAQILLDNSRQLRYCWKTAGSSDTAGQQQAAQILLENRRQLRYCWAVAGAVVGM
jgi:hypothetical protein